MNFDESLLTAYLDGELTPDERELVEQQLAHHREHRETLRELSELQQRLAALPQEMFSADVVAEVQQRIRRQRAAGSAEKHRPGRDQPLPKSHLPATTRKRPTWHLWLPLALAASGLAMLTLASLRQSDEVTVRSLPSEEQASEEQASEAQISDGPASDERASGKRASGERASEARTPASEKSAASRMIAPEGIGAPAAPNPAAPPSAAQSPEAPRVADALSLPMDSARSQGSRPSPRRLEFFYAEPQTTPNSLPAGARLFRLSEVAGETRLEALDGARGVALGVALEGPLESAISEPADGNAVESKDRSDEPRSPFAEAPRVVYEVPPGEIDSILQWLGEREDDSSRSRASRRLAADIDTDSTADATLRPVAVLVDVPAEQLPSLLASIGRRIRESQGTPATDRQGLGGSAAPETADADSAQDGAASSQTRGGATATLKLNGEAVIVLLPAEPQP